MADILTFAKDQLFSPETAHVMGSAFDSAWEQLASSGTVLAAAFRAEQTREALAMHIIELARQGERDPARLRDGAIQLVGKLEYR